MEASIFGPWGKCGLQLSEAAKAEVRGSSTRGGSIESSQEQLWRVVWALFLAGGSVPNDPAFLLCKTLSTL